MICLVSVRLGPEEAETVQATTLEFGFSVRPGLENESFASKSYFTVRRWVGGSMSHDQTGSRRSGYGASSFVR